MSGLNLAVSGDMTGGLEAVFLENRAVLLRFVAARGAGDAAEDVLQELWLKLATVPAGPVGSPLSYLYRMAENLMRDRHRSIVAGSMRDRAWEETRTTTAGISDEPSGERRLIAREALGRVEAVLAALPDRTRAVFRMHRIEGATQRAIAAAFGVSLSTVESDLRRAYRALTDLREGGDEG